MQSPIFFLQFLKKIPFTHTPSYVIVMSFTPTCINRLHLAMFLLFKVNCLVNYRHKQGLLCLPSYLLVPVLFISSCRSGFPLRIIFSKPEGYPLAFLNIAGLLATNSLSSCFLNFFMPPYDSILFLGRYGLVHNSWYV